jgi:choline dehydrogenase-like flavoprotein
VHVATRTAFGGTSWAWAGGCVAFDDIDFNDRAHVAHSGWPLTHDAVAPYYESAAHILNCKESVVRLNGEAGAAERTLAETVFVVSSQPKLAISYWDHFAKSQSITLALNSRVVGLNLGLDGRQVVSLTVASGDRTVLVRAPKIVLAAGGLKSTQLLLAAQRQWPNHFGGAEGALGRYYMGHLAGSIASVTFRETPGSTYSRQLGGSAERRLTLSAATQLSERLLNVAFWPDTPLFYDPAHADGVLSATLLALSMPKLGDILAGRFRRSYLGPTPPHLSAHARNVLTSPARTALGLGRLLWNRAMRRPALGPLAHHAGLGVYTLQYHAESEPNRESCVSLSDKLDRNGLPQMKINLLFGEKDASSIVRAHDVLDRALRGTGNAQIDYLDPPEGREENVLSQAQDGYHQLGTTRMGHDPKTSVVDKDCRVHGVDNLYVASSSVFPTGGHANPTLLATALGVRLAEHLAQTVRTTFSSIAVPTLAREASGGS